MHDCFKAFFRGLSNKSNAFSEDIIEVHLHFDIYLIEEKILIKYNLETYIKTYTNIGRNRARYQDVTKYMKLHKLTEIEQNEIKLIIS